MIQIVMTNTERVVVLISRLKPKTCEVWDEHDKKGYWSKINVRTVKNPDFSFSVRRLVVSCFQLERPIYSMRMSSSVELLPSHLEFETHEWKEDRTRAPQVGSEAIDTLRKLSSLWIWYVSSSSWVVSLIVKLMAHWLLFSVSNISIVATAALLESSLNLETVE